MAGVPVVLFSVALCAVVILFASQEVNGKGVVSLENSLFAIPKCPNGTVIRIAEARWGVGCGCSCDTYYTNLLVRAQCDREPKCSFNTTSQYFGDLLNCGTQYIGVQKTLVVIYNCALS